MSEREETAAEVSSRFCPHVNSVGICRYVNPSTGERAVDARLIGTVASPTQQTRQFYRCNLAGDLFTTATADTLQRNREIVRRQQSCLSARLARAIILD